MKKRILILIATTLVLFSLFSMNCKAGKLVGLGLGPTLFDLSIGAGQTMETMMVVYNPSDTDINAEVIVSDNLKDYVQPEPGTIYIEKNTIPDNAKTVLLTVNTPFLTFGDRDIKGEILLKGTGGMVSPAVGSTFYLHVKGMSILNLTLIGVGIALVIVAIVLFVIKRRKKITTKTIDESIEPIDFSPTKTN